MIDSRDLHPLTTTCPSKKKKKKKTRGRRRRLDKLQAMN
jgi:hypothetical protein